MRALVIIGTFLAANCATTERYNRQKYICHNATGASNACHDNGFGMITCESMQAKACYRAAQDAEKLGIPDAMDLMREACKGGIIRACNRVSDAH